MGCVLKKFTLLASALFLLVCTYLPVSASYTKYVRVGDSLTLECIFDFDDSSWTVIWLRATENYWRSNGYILTEDDVLDDQNTDNRFTIDVHQISTNRKRFSLTVADAKRSDDAVYWCVALPKHDNTVDIAEINKQATDLTGNIFVTIEYPPGPEDPICLSKTTANYQVTLFCCHGFATPFPTRKVLLNGVELNNTKWARNGKLYCLAVNVSAAAEDMYQCKLTSAAFPDYKSTCEYNLRAPEPSVSKPRVPKPSTSPTPTKAHGRSPVWIAPVVIGTMFVIVICIIIGVYIRRHNKSGSYSPTDVEVPKKGFSRGQNLQTQNCIKMATTTC